MRLADRPESADVAPRLGIGRQQVFEAGDPWHQMFCHLGHRQTTEKTGLPSNGSGPDSQKTKISTSQKPAAAGLTRATKPNEIVLERREGAEAGGGASVVGVAAEKAAAQHA